MIDPSLIMPVFNPQPLKAHFVVIRIHFLPISNLDGAANLKVRDLKLNKYVQQMRLRFMRSFINLPHYLLAMCVVCSSMAPVLMPKRAPE